MKPGGQLDLFGAAVLADPLIGLAVLLPDECRTCHTHIAIVGEGSGSHRASLYCGCGQHRGWLPREAAEFLTTLIQKFGRPLEPVAVRRRQRSVGLINIGKRGTDDDRGE
jgi:hypothetical protein